MNASKMPKPIERTIAVGVTTVSVIDVEIVSLPAIPIPGTYARIILLVAAPHSKPIIPEIIPKNNASIVRSQNICWSDAPLALRIPISRLLSFIDRSNPITPR
jgi:hypothetical protein